MLNFQPSTDLNIFLQTQRTLHDRTVTAQIADIDTSTFSEYTALANLPKLTIAGKKYVVKE
jgi:hypothetical protein